MLAYRIVMLFFRDRASVFFSLLATLIILILYILFLGTVMEQSVEAAMGVMPDGARMAMAAVMMAGMIAVTCLSGCLGAMQTAVSDKQDAGRDFLTSPYPRWKIALGYMIGSGIVGFIMTLAAIALSLAYIVSLGAGIPALPDIGRILLTTALAVVCANAFMYFIILFVASETAFSSVSALIGSLSGFLMGIYIPIGVLPMPVQWIVRIFPMSHAAAMYRQIIADGALSAMFHGAPPEMLQDFRIAYGVVFEYGGFVGGFWFSALVLCGYAVGFFALGVVVMRARGAGRG